jgi:hypothetical protein
MKNYTDNELEFVKNYISNGYNGAKAYREAYSTNNQAVAKAEAWRLLRKPKIQELITASEKSCRQIAREIKLDRKRVLLELKKIIKGNYSARERLAGINILCKVTGAFSPDRSEVDIHFSEERKYDTSKMTEQQIKDCIFAEMTQKQGC